ncbi:hypothetical protein F5Y05DRAFT_52984 [Hypoxylon sp. FL0543]|nr:hypothetical protein F5Y05DRAFT_52984 [Hypoxylon sp. FL0543]
MDSSKGVHTGPKPVPKPVPKAGGRIPGLSEPPARMAGVKEETTATGPVTTVGPSGTQSQLGGYPVTAPRKTIDPASMLGNAKIAALNALSGGRAKGGRRMQPPANNQTGAGAAEARPVLRGSRAMTETAPSSGGIDNTVVASGSGGQRDSEKTDDGKASAVTRLSLQCQARGFNPRFIERVTEDGNYVCDVRLRGQTIQGLQESKSSIAAKIGTAERALEAVLQMPRPKVTSDAASTAEATAASVQDHPVGASENAGKNRRRRAPANAGNRRETQGSHYVPDYPGHEEQRYILARIQAMNPPSNRISDWIVADPRASQAFLQGLAMGMGMGMGMGEGRPESRGRQPSPRLPESRGHQPSPRLPATRPSRPPPFDHRDWSPVRDPYERRLDRYRERSPPRHRDRPSARIGRLYEMTDDLIRGEGDYVRRRDTYYMDH